MSEEIPGKTGTKGKQIFMSVKCNLRVKKQIRAKGISYNDKWHNCRSSNSNWYQPITIAAQFLNLF